MLQTVITFGCLLRLAVAAESLALRMLPPLQALGLQIAPSRQVLYDVRFHDYDSVLHQSTRDSATPRTGRSKIETASIVSIPTSSVVPEVKVKGEHTAIGVWRR